MGWSRWTPLNLKAGKVTFSWFHCIYWTLKTCMKSHSTNWGSVLILKPYLSAVWVYLACAFRYGSDDLDVIGLSFRKDIWVKRMQIYPVVGTKPANTPMQEALLKKCGDQGHPFTFTVSITVLPSISSFTWHPTICQCRAHCSATQSVITVHSLRRCWKPHQRLCHHGHSHSGNGHTSLLVCIYSHLITSSFLSISDWYKPAMLSRPSACTRGCWQGTLVSLFLSLFQSLVLNLSLKTNVFYPCSLVVLTMRWKHTSPRRQMTLMRKLARSMY